MSDKKVIVIRIEVPLDDYKKAKALFRTPKVGNNLRLSLAEVMAQHVYDLAGRYEEICKYDWFKQEG